ncbi:MAG: M24 family metallopeptidase [Clostridia bacterium]
MQKRIKKIKKLLNQNNMQALLINKPEDRYYLSNFSGSNAYLLFTKDENYLITDFRYVEQAKKETDGFEIVMYKRNELYSTISDILLDKNIEELTFDSTVLTYEEYTTFNDALEVTLKSSSNILRDMRSVKDQQEIDIIQEAQIISEKAFVKTLESIKPGVTERDLSIELEYQMLLLGASKLAFPNIVASGVRSSLPHGRATDKVIEYNDFITFDFGAYYKGYCSDMTRTVVVGNYTEKQKKIYDIVLNAQLLALDYAKAGISGKELDQVARQYISDAGYGEYFGHGLGHGIGKVVHEAPSANQKSEDILKENQIISIEPGIYIPDWGGVRIEDLIVIKENNSINLNSLTKKLTVI